MMNRNSTILTGALALIGGAALVIAADRLGWIGAPESAAPERSTAGAPALLPPIAPSPRIVDAAGEAIPAFTVREVDSLPRAQRPPSNACGNTAMVVAFDDASIPAAAGVAWESIRHSAVTHRIDCNVELTFDGDRLAHVSSRAPGVVQRVLRRAGDRVRAGQPLAVIESSELSSAKADLLQARATVQLWSDTLERRRPAFERGLVAQKDLIESETHLARARIDLSRAAQRLRNFGVDQAAIDQSSADEGPGSTLDVAAPFDGMIIERHAVLGEVIDTEHVLFVLADTASMWAMLDVRENDLRHVRVGQSVLARLPALADDRFEGAITWVSSAVDQTTRTLKARASLANADGLLRANMFGTAQIVVSDSQPRLVVPRQAVQWDGCCNLVFVRQTDAVFQPFKVRLGADLGGHYVVEDGLQPGDEVVTRGAFLLKTELMRGSIGAGCCEPAGIKHESQ